MKARLRVDNMSACNSREIEHFLNRLEREGWKFLQMFLRGDGQVVIIHRKKWWRE